MEPQAVGMDGLRARKLSHIFVILLARSKMESI
jgi:hypothetical protein